MNNKHEWSEGEVSLIKRRRAQGYSFREIAEELREGGANVTTSSVRHAFLRYDDDEGEHVDRLLKQVRSSQVSANQARREARGIADHLNLADDIVHEIIKATSRLNKVKVPTPKRVKKADTKMTVEALLSDLQLGKMSPDFNLAIAKKRLVKYTDSLLFKIKQQQALGYKVERVLLALLGDIIEGAEKAKKKGADTEVGTPEQVALSVEMLFELVILPLAKAGLPLHVVGVPGNHDHDGPGMLRDKPGEKQLSWIVYKGLEGLCKHAGIKATFNITPGMFAIEEIYGHTVVYEHGYDCTVGEASLANKKRQRADQIKKHVTYFRMGDKHSIHRFHEDTLVVNGAFFGCVPEDRGEEYSSAMGYSGQAAQLAFFHVPRGDDRLPCYDSFIIQLNHVK